MVERIINQLIKTLFESKQLVLKEDENIKELTLELIVSLEQKRSQGEGFINWFTEAIILSKKVEELYASDDEIRTLFHNIN